MAPKECDALLSEGKKATTTTAAASAGGGDTFSADSFDRHLSMDDDGSVGGRVACLAARQHPWIVKASVLASVAALFGWVGRMSGNNYNNVDRTSPFRAGVSPFRTHKQSNLTGPYRLVEAHHGETFFDYYNFQDGPDSLGSAGYNVYVSKDRAQTLGLWNVSNTVTDESEDDSSYVYMRSTPGTGPRDKNGNRFRESVRLEGKKRFDRGLFLLDVVHMPTGCGVWPAFWTTDEAAWPNHGEIDIVEGINNQDVVKTALHTSEGCDMYAHTPRWEWTGEWDTATGIPDRFTGQLDFDTTLQADNCWTMTPHQWANQGCVAVSQENGTIGSAMNDVGGGVYALEWDDANGYIKSWVFKRGNVPANLQESMDGANRGDDGGTAGTVPDPSTWGVPYAYFAIGENDSGCSADHFQNHRLVINLAFCGTVAGNRFERDCPALYDQYNVNNDSVLTCNAYVDSNPDALEDAYWKINGVYMYQRTEYE